MSGLLIYTLVLVAVVIADVHFYGRAKYPDRGRWYFTHLLGGGIAAYLIVGPDHEDRA